MTNWPGYMREYEQATAEIALSDYKLIDAESARSRAVGRPG